MVAITGSSRPSAGTRRPKPSAWEKPARTRHTQDRHAETATADRLTELTERLDRRALRGGTEGAGAGRIRQANPKAAAAAVSTFSIATTSPLPSHRGAQQPQGTREELPPLTDAH